jgi:acid phosphatase
MKSTIAVLGLMALVLGAASAQIPASQHVVVVVEENHNYTQVIGSNSMPYLNSLANQYGLATQYYANTHPSIGNYFMMTTGQIITNNDNYNSVVTADNLVRHLLSAGKTWKSYAEDLPSVGYVGGDTGEYVRHHNPFTYLSDVYNSPVQKLNLVPFTHFATNLNNNALPDISFVIPNLIDDAHDGTLQQADAWLQSNIAPLLTNRAFQQDGMLIIVFDESASDNTHGGGRIAFVAVGPNVVLGGRSSHLYQHENLLRTISEAVGLTTFPGAAATASDMHDLFKQVILSPTSLTFGSQSVGTTSTSQPVTLTNNQSSAVTSLSISASGDFSQTNNCGTTLAGNSSCTINVTFTPTAVGTRTGTLTVSDSAGTQTASLSGTGVANVSLTPSTLPFGSQGVGTRSSPQAATLTNGQTVSVTSISVAITGANAADFAQTNNCGTTLAANSSCTINVTFTPTGYGARSATLTVTDSAGTQSSTLTGTGTDITPPTTQITAPQNNATVSGTVTVTATASDNVGVTSIQIYIDGSQAASGTTSPLNYSWNTTTLSNGSHTIFSKAFDAAGNLGTSATITVTVNNSVQQLLQNTGFETGNLTSWNASGVFLPVVTTARHNTGSYSALLGSSATPEPNGDSSLYQTVTIPSSTTAASLNFYYWGACADTVANDWQEAQIQSSTGTTLTQVMKVCSNTRTWTKVYFNLLPYKGQTIRIYFNDHGNGNGLLTYMYLDDVTVSVKGGANVTLSPASLSFGNQNVGTTSSSQPLTLANNQSTALTGVSVSITGTNASDFAETDNCGTSVAANSNCTINVTFTPTASGARSATLTVTDSAEIGRASCRERV